MASSFLRFLDHTQRRITVGRTPLDEWPARRRDLYLTTHNTRNTQTSMPPVGFEPTISAGERPQTYALDRTATGTGYIFTVWCLNLPGEILHKKKNHSDERNKCFNRRITIINLLTIGREPSPWYSYVSDIVHLRHWAVPHIHSQ